MEMVSIESSFNKLELKRVRREKLKIQARRNDEQSRIFQQIERV